MPDVSERLPHSYRCTHTHTHIGIHTNMNTQLHMDTHICEKYKKIGKLFILKAPSEHDFTALKIQKI